MSLPRLFGLEDIELDLLDFVQKVFVQNPANAVAQEAETLALHEEVLDPHHGLGPEGLDLVHLGPQR